MATNNIYKSIFKSTSIFGGVKLFQILAAVIKAKIVAIYLGTTGMGINGILISSTNLIQTISELGLSFSSVRDISQKNDLGDKHKLNFIITVFLKLLILSSISGALLIIVLSPFLSEITFSNSDYTYEYIWLSLLIIFNTLSGGFQAILQGTNELKSIAKSTILGTLFSISISALIYIYIGVKGIVPALVLSSFLIFTINYFFVKSKFKLIKKTSIKEVFTEGKTMLSLGLTFLVVNLLGSLVPFIINAFIQNQGSISDVGLYNAGISITTQYISLVFAAMTIDYFPKLSIISNDNFKIKNLANQQGEIMLIIIIPILNCLILFAPLVILILLTDQFSVINNFVKLMSLGLYFQAANYAMGLISFAKGDKKIFLSLAFYGNISWLFSSLIGYKLNGLDGIGYLFIIHSLMVFLIVFLTTYFKYNFNMSKGFVNLFLIGLISLTINLFINLNYNGTSSIIITSLILLFVIFYSLYQLNKRIELIKIN